MQTWNVNVERQIGPALGVMVGYFGSKGDRLRISRNLNQFVNGVRPYPTLSRDEPDPARRRARQHHRDRQPRLVALQGPVADGQPAAVQGAAVQRVVHAVEVDRHELAQHARRSSCRTATTSPTARDRRTTTSGTASSSTRSTSCRSRATALEEGWQLGVVTQAQTGNPINIVTGINTFTGVDQHAAAGSGRRSGDHRHRRRSGSTTRVCDPRIAPARVVHVELGVRAAGVGGRRVPLRQPRPQRGHRARLQQHRLLAHQEPGAGRQRARLQFRIEVFNLFNQANLGLPGRIATVGSTAFGVITNTRFPTGDSGSARQVQFAIKALF